MREKKKTDEPLVASEFACCDDTMREEPYREKQHLETLKKTQTNDAYLAMV